MVKILREQAQQYGASLGQSIQTSQVAQNVGGINDVIQSVGKIFGAVQSSYNKEAEEYDQNIINAEIGQKADILAERDIQKEVTAGTLNPDTDEGRKRIDEIVASKYEPYRGLGQTEKYENVLTTMQRRASDKGLRNAFAAYDKVTKEKARVAAKSISKGFGEEAYAQGAMGINQPIQGTEEYIKFVSKDKGIPEDKARVLVESELAMAKLRGIIDSDPVAAAYMLGDEEIVKDAYITQHPETGVVWRGWNEKALRVKDESEIEKGFSFDKAKSDEDLKSILGENYFNAITEAQGDLLAAEKRSYELELKKVPENSPVAREYKQKIKELDKKLQNPDESSALDLVRSDFASFNNNELQRALKESYARFKQDVKVDSYDNTWKIYSTAMDTDLESAKRAQTEIWLAQNNLIPMTPIESKMMSDFNGEVDKKEMINAYHEFLENSSKVKPELHETYEATMEIHGLIQEMFEPDLTPMQLVKKGYDVINKTALTSCTDGQFKNIQSLVAKIIQDRGFGDVASSVLNSVDRAWFDESFVGDFAQQNTSAVVPQMMWASKKEEKMALPAGREYRTTKDAVQRMIQSEGERVVNKVMNGLLEAYYLPKEQRTQKIQDLQNYIVESKRNIYSKAMKNYGIDLNYLDNELKTRGMAYVNINGVLREYKGRDSQQRALWATPKRDPIEKQQLDRLFGRITTEK